ncbi:hypothetical protein DERP_000728 [Dermatophagoides pteronyssinus]|uniref:Uncharacterized protein n=1 Tax=Dermatophagoides pteronyssinus TaxID=6956 RepID=A0ABQ8J113_DERPT|nr:hypothetical protein DERP_000728 [Dermatophagoides pteronyssinus]
MESSKHKVIDSVKTRLQELIKSLDILYEKLDKEFNEIITIKNLESIGSIISEGFDDICNGRPPFNPISDRSSNDDDDDDYSDENETEEFDNDDDDDVENEEDENSRQQREKQVQDIIRMVQSSFNMTR